MTAYFSDIEEEFGLKGEDSGMIVKDVVFSPDHKTFYITAHITRDIGPYALTDSTKTKIIIEEKINGVPLDASSRSHLVKATNTGSEEIAKMGYKVLSIVDLTTSQALVDLQKNMIAEMSTVFNHDNLYVAFMEDGKISETVLLTPYILDNYFVATEKKDKYLFSSILSKEKELASGEGIWDPKDPLSLVVFSDAKVYDEDDYPIEKDYFQKKKELLDYAETLQGKNIKVNFVNVSNSTDDYDETDNDEVHSIFNIIAEKTNGVHQDHFNYTELQQTILGSEGDSIADDRFDFVNPDKKIYSGSENELKISFYNIEDGKLITTATAKIIKGTSYKPVIVNGLSTPLVILKGCVITIVILLAAWLIFQLIVPFVRYKYFLNKYVVDYTGPNMSVNNRQVGESCYYCKSPFEKGDKIVVKCDHTMHKDCWDENSYHCPEHGSKCKKGTHYYNYKHLFDPENAPFYLKWILISIFAAGCAWVVFTAHLHTVVGEMFEDLIFAFTEVPEGSKEAALAIQEYDDPMGQAPAFGLTLGFFLTLGLSWLTVHVTDIKRQWLEIFFRSIISGVACCFVFFTIAIIGFTVEWDIAYLVDWIPWSVCAFILVLASTWRTPVRINTYVWWVCLILGVCAMLLWAIQFRGANSDYRIFQLIIFIIYSLTLSLCIAYEAPRSHHYFLRMTGGIKPIDVALFKWFKNNPNYVVTIGRSVDCSLQISWDIRNDIAPVQAEIKKKGAACILIPLEDGVYIKEKNIIPGKKIILYNGLTFLIGDTEFTYIEKDIRKR
ncbi:MAG: E3 ubiquitin protein ligase [Muribaculaceae bacterium]|nr:E3 ubiquitin protein ligase [Muribaculaceae bacterium]